MKKVIFLMVFSAFTLITYSQGVPNKTLEYYIEYAKENSPLINDYKNQYKVSEYEVQRLKAFYTQSKLEVNGNLLFVPIVSKDNGNTRFQLTPQNAVDYYGYDQGVSSGNLQAGLTWTQPLFASSSYKAAHQQALVTKDINLNNIQLQGHELQRLVTDQYILCLLDKQKIAFADSILIILNEQENVIQKLAQSAIMKQSDYNLIKIEKAGYKESKRNYEQSYQTHLLDLNILCGIKDTSIISLEEIKLDLNTLTDNSRFLEKYKLDSLNLIARQTVSEIQYKPRINLFVDGGLRTSQYNSTAFNHFGMSAGITFAWTLFDGRQRKITRNQTNAELNTVSFYRENFIVQNNLRTRQYLSELKGYDDRSNIMQQQLTSYIQVLADYNREIQKGQLSVINYITVLKNRTQVAENYYLLRANRLLLINAYNYYNW
ncbi:TolC family protein [Macellibacteroides fermentans]|uniref:Outer membrane efflux protein n=1 Tax=Parabacteroides chartae TaxID=1037355 RepID=A0A1T5DRM2_9BACT|nr:TolC family protein [Parabacteroides chartae]SKB74133.1 Outer membrane efflux protein [Parabacteroides chartae]